ncbi:MAG: hypothetical protein KFF73_19520 [Cyclobacteriaceae bacterium]|nr:hypothetical protein [Cyclobacteriaceae bacterium]
MNRTAPIHILLFLMVLFSSFISRAQTYKQEKEERIRMEDMPRKALEELQPFIEKAGKVRFYHETDGTRHSYECKFQSKGQIYSIEFSEDGKLEDVEVVVGIRELPDKTATAITDYLGENFNRYIIRKIQKQFTSENGKTGAKEIIEKALEGMDGDLKIKYELEVDGKQDRILVSQEILFDHEGSFLQKRKIIRRQVDNMLY